MATLSKPQITVNQSEPKITPTKSVIQGWNGTIEGVKALAKSLERNKSK
jgi:hypothetical protein